MTQGVRMGFRYQKRIKISKGAGVNISKSGVSASFRTKYGSIGPKGFSIKTGIPGLTYKVGKNKNTAGLLLAITIITVGASVLWKGILYIGWFITKAYQGLRKKESNCQSINDYKMKNASNNDQ